MNPATLTFRELPLTDESDRGIWSELDLRSCAQVHWSSAHSAHPIDHLFDGSVGEGASRWVGGRRNRAETILLIFDEPVDIMRCAFEAEEREVVRTQQVTAEYLLANGDVYRQCFIQEFSFSPRGRRISESGSSWTCVGEQTSVHCSGGQACARRPESDRSARLLISLIAGGPAPEKSGAARAEWDEADAECFSRVQNIKSRISAANRVPSSHLIDRVRRHGR